MNKEAAIEKYPTYKEYLWYEAHEEEILQRYFGRFVVVSGKKIIGDFGSLAAALQETLKHQKPGSFIIQHALPANPKRLPRLRNHQLVTIHGA
ncbi:MAG: hypothetical protein AAB316_01585 [Bacteroidota bacterium]